MPRNPKAEARRKVEAAQANFRAAEKAVARASAVRTEAMLRAVDAGYTFAEVGVFCNVSRGHVSNMVMKRRIMLAEREAS